MVPLVSIIIPVFNRPALIDQCLTALLNQRASFPYEIELVDDGSKDDTPQVLKGWEKRHPDKISVVIKGRNEGQWKTRNIGIEKARGKIIAFIDSDCIAEPEWLERLTAPIREGKCAITQGYSTGDTRFTWQKIIQESYDDWFASMAKDGFAKGYDTRNAAAAKSVFDKIGMFEVRHAEDADLGARMIAAGYKITYVPSAVISHQHRKEYRKEYKTVYLFATRYPLILRRNATLLKAQAGIIARVLYGLYALLLIPATPVLLWLWWPGALIGWGLLLLAALARSLRLPYGLTLARMFFHTANAIAVALGTIRGLPYATSTRDPEDKP